MMELMSTFSIVFTSICIPFLFNWFEFEYNYNRFKFNSIFLNFV
jgi:hypothetical protein